MRRILSGTYHIFNDARVSSRVLKLNPSIQRLQPPARNIHASPVLLAKAKVKKAGKDKKNDTVVDDDVEITLPDLDNLDTTMEGKVNFLKFELGKIRGGHATSDMLDFVTVNAYGDNIPITDTAQITLKSATKLVVATYDADITSHVATAIRECGLGFAPTVDGTNITITVPKPSKEARANLVKVATQHAEKMKSDVRHDRKRILDKLKALKGKVSEDDTRRMAKEIDAITEKKIEKISKLVKEKETQIML